MSETSCFLYLTIVKWMLLNHSIRLTSDDECSVTELVTPGLSNYRGCSTSRYLDALLNTDRLYFEQIVGSMQHCRNCNFFRNELFCSFDPIKHIYIICENILNELLIFLL